MLGKYEKRYFKNNSKVWQGMYRHLNNVLHWHSECELIRIISGSAKIKIGTSLFNVKDGDCLFCAKNELHYIISESDTLIEVVIFHRDLLSELTDKYKPVSPLLSNGGSIKQNAEKLHDIITNKPRFYNEAAQNCAQEILLDIYNNNDVCPIISIKQTEKDIIDKINKDFATISFEEIVKFSGYSSSHFSKVFKRLAGINFCDYLNFVKIANAVSMLQSKENLTVTEIAFKCGFSTIRSFNRVFKKITGFTPRNLPNNHNADFNIAVYDEISFDPTSQTSVKL